MALVFCANAAHAATQSARAKFPLRAPSAVRLRAAIEPHVPPELLPLERRAGSDPETLSAATIERAQERGAPPAEAQRLSAEPSPDAGRSGESPRAYAVSDGLKAPARVPGASAARPQGFWSDLFDGARLKNANHDEPPQDLLKIAAPWKTRVQLERLRRATRPPSETFRFAVVGDAEPGRFIWSRKLYNRPGIFRKFLSEIEGLPASFVFQLGDMVSRGTSRNYLRFFLDLASSGLKKTYLTAIGNHDRRKPHGRGDSTLYRTLFGATNYFFDFGGVRFVALDTSARRLTQQQLRWLKLVLDTERRKIVFTHIPPASLRDWPDYGGLKGIAGFQRGAKEFTRLMSEHKVARVYMGHVHGFGAQDYKGVRYVLTGGGGSPLYPSQADAVFHHYLDVEVSPDGIRETVRRADGTSFVVGRVPRPGSNSPPGAGQGRTSGR